MEGFFEKYQMGIRILLNRSNFGYVCHRRFCRYSKPPRGSLSNPCSYSYHGIWLQNKEENAGTRDIIASQKNGLS